MAFEILIKPVVFMDAEEAVLYYEKRLTGLGKRFYHHFLKSLDNIQQKPFAHSFVKEPVRRFKVAKFPYKIFYLISNETIFIIGLSHNKRSNAFVKKRLKLM